MTFFVYFKMNKKPSHYAWLRKIASTYIFRTASNMSIDEAASHSIKSRFTLFKMVTKNSFECFSILNVTHPMIFFNEQKKSQAPHQLAQFAYILFNHIYTSALIIQQQPYFGIHNAQNIQEFRLLLTLILILLVVNEFHCFA